MGEYIIHAVPDSVIEYGQVVYYPHIRFRDRIWLRTSALYHDAIWRITPEGLSDYELELETKDLPDPAIIDDIRALRDEGVVRNEIATPYVTRVGDDFAAFVKANLTDPERRAKLVPQLSANEKYQWYKIYPGKMDPKLREVLRELHLAREIPHDRHGDWELDVTTGGMYMYFLAQALSKDRPIISDNPAFQALAYAAPGLNLTRRSGPDYDKGFVLAIAAFETVQPLGFQHVPMSKLIKFRNEHADERVLFQQELAKLGKDLGSVGHQDQLDEIVERQKLLIKGNLKRLKRKLKSLQVECARSVFTFSVPVWGGAAAVSHGLLATNPYLIAGSGAVSFGFAMTKYLLDRKNARTECPWSYLLSMEQRLTPKRATEALISLSLSGSAS